MRPAQAGDLDAILGLEESGFAPRERWSRGSWASELEADNRIVLVAGPAHDGDAGREHDRVAGPERDSVAGVASVQHVGGVAELNRIVVAPDARRRGTGRALLEAGIAAARAVECEELLLEVRHDNAPALALYGAFGFAEIARRANYYGDGIDAVIMRRELEADDD